MDEKKTEKNPGKDSESSPDTDLDEEEFIVEKILKMRTTKKGKVQCKSIDWPRSHSSFLLLDLLKWKGFPDSENTWVSEELRLEKSIRFPIGTSRKSRMSRINRGIYG